MAEENKAKMVIVGDGMIGKTCLIERFQKAGWDREVNTEYVPTTFRDESIPLIIDEDTNDFEHFDEQSGHIADDKFTLEVWDTAGQESMEALRQLAYPHTHCFLIGYDITNSGSLDNVETVWDTELHAHTPAEEKKVPAPRILVGTKCDLRNEDSVTYEEAYEMAKKVGCCAVIETSSVTKHNVRELEKMVIQSAKAHKEKKWVPFKIEDFEPGKAAPEPAPEPAPAAPAPAPAPAPASVAAPAAQAPAPAPPAAAAPAAGPKKDGGDGCCVLL
eukprot:TRINITY_DN1483_c0_g1_i1.p1 TRINITY_DN1483_c0_g1~~TRINITY_DN1483_c0_g1_i1.p1  ORF type:complete len:274 (-),score=71.33 TRINITY_DN1483_c0_g1_i1:48-869(-)